MHFQLLRTRVNSAAHSVNMSMCDSTTLHAIWFCAGNYISHKANSSLLITAGLWTLMMTVLVGAYTGDLKSWLIWPHMMAIINSLEDVLHRNVKVTVDVDTPLADSFLVFYSFKI